MGKGGARNRSGPSFDPASGRSERRGLSLTALPAEGYDGDVPDWPLPDVSPRELEIWAEAWRSPQACVWARQSWRWTVVAEYARMKAAVELAPIASAALIAHLHRYRDQLGLTPAGLRENGWAIAADEVGEKRDSGKSAGRPKVERRLRAVGDDGDGVE